MSSLPPLRLWQESAYKNWKSNNLRGIVEVATAGGKTRFALECLLHYRTLVKDECIVVITPTTALADQWNFALTEDMGILESDICIWPETSDLRGSNSLKIVEKLNLLGFEPNRWRSNWSREHNEIL